MANRIPEAIRQEVRTRWIRGGITDEALARQFGIRPGTLRAWKQKDCWTGLREQLHGIVSDEVKARLLKERTELNQKHDQLGAALEGMIVKAMREGGLDPAGLRALASALAGTQRVRRIATGIDRIPEKAEQQGPTTIIFEDAVPPPGSGRGSAPAGAA